MAIQTLRPNATVAADGWTASSTTLHGDTSDDSDTTWAISPAASAGLMKLGLTSYTLSAGERVKQARVRDRIFIDQFGSTSQRARLWIAGEIVSFVSQGATNQNIDRTGAWGVFTSLITQSDLDDAFYDVIGDANNEEVFEAYADLDVWERTDTPTVVTDPAGAGGPPPVINGTDQPVVESHTAALNDGTPGLWSRQVKVIRDAVYAGFASDDDITNETDVEWEDLNTSFGTPSTAAGSPDTIQVGTPLANNDTYKVFVRYGKNDVAGSTLWSLWGEYEFTLTLTLPTPPTVAVTVEQAQGRQKIDVTTAALTHDTVESIRVQRSDDGGKWRTIRGGFITPEPDGDPLAPSTLYTFHDYDAPRDVSLEYRARVTEGTTASGTTLTSDWTTHAPVTHTNDGTWWLFDVGTWGTVVSEARIVELPAIQIEQSQGVFYPEGRRTAVVVQGEVHGDDGTYELLATDTEIPTVDGIARWSATVLVKTPFGAQKYIHWTSRGMVLAGTPARERHRWTLGYVEVDDGIGVDG